MKQLHWYLAAALLIASCRFDFDNPAERLVPGEIRGRTAQEKEGEAGSFEALAHARVRMRGLPFVLETRETGFFAFLDLPPGEYDLLFDTTAADQHPRAAHRAVSLRLGPDGQTEGVTLGDVPLLHTASVTGRVIDEETELPIPFATVVDDLTLQTVTADADGVFTFPSLAIGEHTLRAAGSIIIDNDTSRPMVGGTLSVSLSQEHERQAVRLDHPLPMRDATGRGRVQFEVGVMTPGNDPFGLDEIVVKATECEGTREITLTPPSSNGQVDDDQVPEGCWNIRLEPPVGPQSAEFTLQTEVDNVVVLADTEVALGKLLLVSAPSLFKSRNSCDVDADCGEGGVCDAGQCTKGPVDPTDPCEVNNGGCHDDATCSSTEGGLVLCSCDDGFVGNGLSCADIDECTELDRETGRPLHGCGANSICVNEPGSWSCQCADGFVDVEGTCVDVALCDCDDTQVCVEDSGTYTCECAGGFRDENGVCVDIDECTEVDPETEAPLHDCGPNSFCVNGTGSYSCECDEGFRDESGVCVDIDECTEVDPQTEAPLHDCGANSFCLNEAGTYFCECVEGFRNENGECVNIDECTELDPVTETPLHDCDPNAVCLDGIGSYSCECSEGYVGDGRECAPVPLSYVQLALGEGHTCGILSDGSLWCWGWNETGQLGLGDNDDDENLHVHVPSQVKHPEGLEWRKVFATHSVTCAIDESDELWCWGDNAYGLLGLGSAVTGNVREPTAVAPGTTWVNLVMSTSEVCGVTSDEVLRCWGITNPTPTPFDEPGGWVDIVGGAGMFCGIRHQHPPDGNEGDPKEFRAWCWGNNHGGQIPGEYSFIEIPTPTDFFHPLQPPELVVSSAAICTIDPDDRTLWCQGQALDGLERISDLRWLSVSAADYTLCGIAENDVVHCWGNNWMGQTGTGDWNDWVEEPTPVGGDLRASIIAQSSDHSCAVAVDGDLYCWGANESGGLGVSGWPALSTPQSVTTATDWTHLTSGSGATCALRGSGPLWCWGHNEGSQVVDNTDTWMASEPYVRNSDVAWRSISLGSGAGCGIDSDDHLWCWGSTHIYSSNFGLEADAIPVSNDRTWSTVSTAGFTCAIDGSGSLWCGGSLSPFNVQPGDGDLADSAALGLSDRSPPGSAPLAAVEDHGWIEITTQEPGEWTAIAAGFQHACGIQNGDLWCFGNNHGGLLGDPSAQDGFHLVGLENEEPQPDWVTVSVGFGHSCAIDEHGRLWCWGFSHFGQLGVPPPANPEEGIAPLEIGDGGWVSVSAGEFQTCAVRNDNTGWCWGGNLAGELGQGHFDPLSGPQQIPGEWLHLEVGSAAAIDDDQAFHGHVCGIRTDGSLWCWGESRYGQTGNGVAGARTPKLTQAPSR